MIQTVINAMNELVDLLRENEHLWIKSSIDGSFMIHRDTYNNNHPKNIHVNSPLAWIESSKESMIVSMAPMSLLDIFKEPVALS